MTFGLQATGHTSVGRGVWLGDPQRAPEMVQGDINGMERAETGGVVLLFSKSPEYAMRWDTREQAEHMVRFLPSIFRFEPVELTAFGPDDTLTNENIAQLIERAFAQHPDPSATPVHCPIAEDHRWAHFEHLTSKSLLPTFYCRACATVLSFEDFLAWGRAARAHYSETSHDHDGSSDADAPF